VKDIQNPTIHTQIKALVYSNLAELYVQKGEFERAEPLGEVSVALLEEAIFKDSPDNLNVAICKSSLGVAKQQLKKYEAAEVLFRSAYDIYMKMGTPDESNVIECVTRLGTVLMALGMSRAALVFLLDRITFTDTLFPRLDRCEEAEQKLKFHLQSLQSSGNHNKSMGLLFTLGRLYFSQKNYTEAEPYYKKVRDLFLIPHSNLGLTSQLAIA
jgi:tetratricopeptide (TPR) repeat protein